MDKDFLLGILFGKVPTREALDYLGLGSLPTNHYTAHIAAFMAYIKLAKMGEIDGSRIYNLASKSFITEPNHGDIGLTLKGIYRYHNNGWSLYSEFKDQEVE